MGKIFGLIAEYNPLHEGHKWQLQYARNVLGAEAIVVIMSGDFTQRGIPACIDKYTRAGMAIEAGADIVIELPVVAATAGAESFARGGVALMNALGFVDRLIFGAETPEVSLFERASEILNEEPEDYKRALKSAVSSGINFAGARVFALRETSGIPGIEEFLSTPNNALGLEYVRSLKLLNSPMEYLPVKRQPGYQSSTQIRATLDESRFILSRDFSLLIHEALIKNEDFSGFYESNEDLGNRILKTRDEFTNVDHYCLNVLKSKNYTYARIMRVLFHILLNIRYSDLSEFAECGWAPYAHVLGVKQGRENLLSLIKSKSQVPVFTSHKEGMEVLPERALNLYKKDLLSGDLYRIIKGYKDGKTPVNIRREGLRVC